MYASFFGLRHEPFSIAPDPRFLYLSERHREALAHLLYGVKGGGGFVLLTGEIGAGKTTVCRAFLDQVPDDCEVAYIFNPKLTVHELLKAVCDEFGIEAPAAGTPGVTVQDYVEPLNRHLLEAHGNGRKCILIIDEAQNLEPEVLEQLRLLTNLETAERKLLQIILIGQPELREMVARPELEQLAQRIVARFHLGPLSAAETAQYVLHRMRVAGLGAHSPFTAQQLLQIHKLTGGVPRRINLLCDRALLGAYSRGQPQVDRQVVSHAAQEVFDQRQRGERGFLWRQLGWGVGIACVAAGVGFVASAWQTGVLQRGAAEVPGAALAGVAQSPAASVAAVAAVAAVPARPEPVSGGRELGAQENLAGWADESSGWRALARGWGVELAGGEACDTARRAGLVCYRSQGSLALARQLDRPAILAWVDAAQRRQHVLLLGLDDREALVQGPEGRVRLPLARLATVWRGDYATLWRAPVGYLDPGSPAQLSPVTFQWLTQALLRLPGLAEVAATQPPAQQLRARIQAFQVTQGLQPDGLLGPVTVMRLNRAAGVDEPALPGLQALAAERTPGS